MSLHFHPLRVNEVHLDAEDALVIGFEVPVELRETFRFTAGQYLTLRADVNGQDLRRSYSICAGEGDGVLRVGVRRVEGGAFSSFVHGGLKPGDVIEVFRRKVVSACRKRRARATCSASPVVQASRPSSRS